MLPRSADFCLILQLKRLINHNRPATTQRAILPKIVRQMIPEMPPDGIDSTLVVRRANASKTNPRQSHIRDVVLLARANLTPGPSPNYGEGRKIPAVILECDFVVNLDIRTYVHYNSAATTLSCSLDMSHPEFSHHAVSCDLSPPLHSLERGLVVRFAPSSSSLLNFRDDSC
jgi:hypothetical protein